MATNGTPKPDPMGALMMLGYVKDLSPELRGQAIGTVKAALEDLSAVAAMYDAMRAEAEQLSGQPSYRIALRPHDSIEGAEDDIVVNDVDMFRLEQMNSKTWFACCYLRGEDALNRIAWDIRWSPKDKEVVVTTTEYPDGVPYEADQ